MEKQVEKFIEKKFIETLKRKLRESIEKNSSFDGDVLNIGNLIEVKPVYEQETCQLVGYDIYKYASEEAMEDEDYDFDGDFITTVYIS